MATNNFNKDNCICVNRHCGCCCQRCAPQAYNNTGPTGPIGPQGPQGLAGPQGPTGPQGSQGPVGPAGPIGPQGLQGIPGIQGVQGAKGEAGAIGPTGPAGMAATISVEPAVRVPFDDSPGVVNIGTPQAAILKFTIPSGKPGDPGAQGQKGDTGEQGPKGDTGEQGPKGDTGARGPKGDTGPRGVNAYGQIISIISKGDLFKDIPTQVPLKYAGEYDKVTPAMNTITINEAGYYALNYSMHPNLQLTADYADLTFSLRSNGVDIPYTSDVKRATKGTRILDFYGTAIAELPAGAIIDSAFKCNEDAVFFFDMNYTSSFSLFKIA